MKRDNLQLILILESDCRTYIQSGDCRTYQREEKEKHNVT